MQTHMHEKAHTHIHTHLPLPSLQAPLQLSINFPFCLVAADIPNTAISGLAYDLAPWKPSAELPALGSTHAHHAYWINNSQEMLLHLNEESTYKKVYKDKVKKCLKQATETSSNR